MLLTVPGRYDASDDYQVLPTVKPRPMGCIHSMGIDVHSIR